MSYLEAVRSVRELVWALDVCEEGLLAEPELHLGAEEGRVVEVGDHALHGQPVAHLQGANSIAQLHTHSIE